MSSTNDAARFWREYEERLGEKILKYSLGKYLTGWKEFEGPLWGLAIVTEGGFRFHHFPHENWIVALSRLGGGGGETPKEKTLFVPRVKIRSYQVIREKSWWKRLLTPSSPRVMITYSDGENGTPEAEAVLVVEIDQDSVELENALKSLVTA